MDWNGKQDRRALKRIVALLFAFAALADLAGAKPRPLRAAVLWLLRAAEAIGRDFVSRVVEDCGRPAQLSSLEHDPEKWEPVFGKRSCFTKEIEHDDDSRKIHHALDEADHFIRLARSFRALAELLGDLMRRRLAPPPSGRIGSRPIRDLMLNPGNPVADHPALAHSTLEPLCIDSS